VVMRVQSDARSTPGSTLIRVALLALLPLASPYILPTLTLRRVPPRIVLQEEEPDEYIPPLDPEPPPEREPLPGFPRRFSEGTGPYTVSHGVPIDENETNPSFLTANDWHISSSYTAQQLEEITSREQGENDAAAGRTAELDENMLEDPFATKEYMVLDQDEPEGTGPHEVEPQPKTPMPSSWQEFQFLESSVARYMSADALPVPAGDQEEAKEFGHKLAEIYPGFMNVLSEGWEFVYDPDVEGAGLFLQRMKKWEAQLGGKKKQAAFEWDLEGERQPFVGENKHD